MKQHNIEKIEFPGDNLLLKVDGKTLKFPLGSISKPLLKADSVARESYTISPSGYGIHWEMIDEDLSIDGLLGIIHEPKRKPEPACVSEPTIEYPSKETTL